MSIVYEKCQLVKPRKSTENGGQKPQVNHLLNPHHRYAGHQAKEIKGSVQTAEVTNWDGRWNQQADELKPWLKETAKRQIQYHRKRIPGQTRVDSQGLKKSVRVSQKTG